MELILQFFERCVPLSQRTLNALVEQQGGPAAALQSQGALQALIEREHSFERIPDLADSLHKADSSRHRFHSGFDYSRAVESQRSRRRTRSYASGAENQRVGAGAIIPAPYAHETGFLGALDHRNPYLPLSYGGWPAQEFSFSYEQEIAMLRQELSHMPSVEMKKNLEAFERKFEIQTRELAEEMKKVVVHEGNRVVRLLLAGPHERIIDTVHLYHLFDATSPAHVFIFLGSTRDLEGKCK